jgi:hypothetical protein
MSQTLRRLLTHYDVADILQCPARRVLRMARKQEIPCIEMPDGEVLFREEDIAKWLEERRRPAIDSEVSNDGN